jgi:hypothetical protein
MIKEEAPGSWAPRSGVGSNYVSKAIKSGIENDKLKNKTRVECQYDWITVQEVGFVPIGGSG